MGGLGQARLLRSFHSLATDCQRSGSRTALETGVGRTLRPALVSWVRARSCDPPTVRVGWDTALARRQAPYATLQPSCVKPYKGGP